MTTREVLENFSREEGIALFNERKTDKEVYDILVSKGLTDDYETFCAEAQKLFKEKFSKMSKEEVLKQIEGAELTDEQLEQIAGGTKITELQGGDVVVGTAAAAGAVLTAGIAYLITGSAAAGAI